MILGRKFSKAYKQMDAKDIYFGLVNAEYAVRGLLPQTAAEMESSVKYPFNSITYCNIGNPLSFGQQPMTFNRQVLSCLFQPQMINEMPFSDDVKNRARFYLENSQLDIGAYSDSAGYRFIRKRIADYISKRDGYPSDHNKIFLINGASEGVNLCMRALIKNDDEGILIPIPQYPLYSALISLNKCHQIKQIFNFSYYLNESKNWSADIVNLERDYDNQVSKGIIPKAMVVINPGNPTGQVMDYESLKEVVNFCERKNLVILADEDNIYVQDREFISLKKVVCDLNSPVSLISFHSTSKGLFGECGLRGGYMEVHNIQQSAFEQLFKLKCINLCSNTVGQFATDLLISPPNEQENSSQVKYQTQQTIDNYNKEYNNLFDSLKDRANIIYDSLSQMSNISWAMYAFPSIQFSQSVLQKAQEKGMKADTYYAMELLKETGIVIVPGRQIFEFSGFGQKENTYHFRITTLILPQERLFRKMKVFQEFNERFHKVY